MCICFFVIRTMNNGGERFWWILLGAKSDWLDWFLLAELLVVVGFISLLLCWI